MVIFIRMIDGEKSSLMKNCRMIDVHFEHRMADDEPCLYGVFKIQPNMRLELVFLEFMARYNIVKTPQDVIDCINSELRKNNKIQDELEDHEEKIIISEAKKFLKSGKWYEEEQLVKKTRKLDLPLIIHDVETSVGKMALEKKLGEC